MSRTATASNVRGRLLAAGLVASGLWAVAASALLLFHDDVLAGFLARQGAMQAAYEARLADLRTELDRGGSERGQAQDGLAAQLAGLVARQGELERRQAALAGLAGDAADPQTTGSLPAGSPAPVLDLVPDLGLRRGGEPFPGRRSARETGLRLAVLGGRLDGLAAAQAVSLDRFTERAGRDLGRLRRALGGTGLDLRRLAAPAEAGLGGPLVPLDANPFSAAVALAARTAGDARTLRHVAASLPLARPIRAEHGVASGFGTRLDPFTRGLALHTGLDLKAEMGEPALATAPGRVVAAEPAGGYGNMVEIDHGRGVVTRFAHLARIAVRPGQWLRAGDLVGRVGSTGRSTGAHLHYETRIDGEPVDPQGFLDAGRQLAAAEP
ncbi:peptidoglycan DD-metalloendopeptidase family protein [uncultured Methylobacterium sp.]|uniref:peptidoglycan DD-metalloendopeptidase family protein n=1 Tax=uncultured Methylobacterium sp. TaxID=157278 RepID=UPI0035C9F2DC